MIREDGVIPGCRPSAFYDPLDNMINGHVRKPCDRCGRPRKVQRLRLATDKGICRDCLSDKFWRRKNGV